MPAEENIIVQCPHCETEVVAPKAVLTKPARCPKCGEVGQFRVPPTDEEIMRDAAAAAADGLKTAGKAAGGLLSRAASFGASKWRKHREHTQQVDQWRSRLAHHLQWDHPSQNVLSSLVQDARKIGLNLSKELQPHAQAIQAFALRAIASVRQGQLDPSTEFLFGQYVSLLGINDQQARAFAEACKISRSVRDIEAGNVRQLEGVTDLVVRSSEVVWYQTPAKQAMKARGGEQEWDDGLFYVTSMRIVYVSQARPFQAQLADINAVQIQSGRLFLAGKTQSASNEVWVPQVEIAAAHVRRALSTFHRQTDVSFENKDSRHISQEVKHAVWQRDGGHCVECGASDYLEFDHIIPHSKGGASTADNLQLLCRRCNMRKSNRI